MSEDCTDLCMHTSIVRVLPAVRTCVLADAYVPIASATQIRDSLSGGGTAFLKQHVYVWCMYRIRRGGRGEWGQKAEGGGVSVGKRREQRKGGGV